MSGMNFLEKLLDGGAVEWKALGDLFEFKNGINKGKEFFEIVRWIVSSQKQVLKY